MCDYWIGAPVHEPRLNLSVAPLLRVEKRPGSVFSGIDTPAPAAAEE